MMIFNAIANLLGCVAIRECRRNVLSFQSGIPRKQEHIWTKLRKVRYHQIGLGIDEIHLCVKTSRSLYKLVAWNSCPFPLISYHVARKLILILTCTMKQEVSVGEISSF